jgi:hypothetical protein
MLLNGSCWTLAHAFVDGRAHVQIELYEELGLGSSSANVQAMRLEVAVPPPPPGTVFAVHRTHPSLRQTSRRK